MRYDNNIETMHQLSSQRGHEERSAIAERNRNRFLSSFGMTDKFADGRGNLATGIEKIADGRHRLPGGANNLPIDAFKLPIEGLNGRLTHLNCQLSAQVARWEQKTTRGRLRSFGEHEKCSGDGSAWSVSTSFGPGTAQTARGRVNPIGGAVDMQVLENDDMWMKQEMEYEHFSSSQEEYVRQLADGRWCLNTISAPPHRCKRGPLLLKKEEKLKPVVANFLSSRRGNEERSVAVEQQSNRFLSSFGMTEDKGEYFTPRFGLTPYNGACGLNCPPTGRGTSGADGFEEDPAEVGGYRLEANSSKLEAQKKLTIKYNNPSSKRIAGTTKNAHLSVLKTMGTGDNKLFPFFLISKHALKCEKFFRQFDGEMSASWRTEGFGTLANTNKTSAYET